MNNKPDHEVSMARADLYKIAEYAIKLHRMLEEVSEEQGIEGWMQSKITKASDYVSSVYHTLSHDMKFGEGDDMQVEAYGRYNRRDAYQRDYDHSVAGMGRRQSRAYQNDGGANDERHDLDPTDWYFVKDGKMFAVSVYPHQEREAIALGYSRTRNEAKAKASQQGVAEGSQPNDIAVYHHTGPDAETKAKRHAMKLGSEYGHFKHDMADKNDNLHVVTQKRYFPAYTKQQGVAEGFFGIDDKIKGKIQNIVGKLSDEYGMWDHKAQTFTPDGLEHLKSILKFNEKYIKYALSLTSKDYEAEGVAEEKQRLDPKCWDGYKKQGTKMKGDTRVNNCVPESAEQGVAEGSEQVYKVLAVDKSNALSKQVKLKVKASSLDEVFERLAINDWYPLEINGVEVINGKRLKQGVAEGSVEENKKGVRAPKHTTKPRNFVAKNAVQSGAGAHKDKKKAAKQGDTKHKAAAYENRLDAALQSALMEKAPKGWEGTVKAMKKHDEIDNPYALAHYMKNKGYKSHKKK